MKYRALDGESPALADGGDHWIAAGERVVRGGMGRGPRPRIADHSRGLQPNFGEAT